MSTVIPFSRPASARHGSWSQQELAEFYRVEAALLRAGFSIASAHGLSDEGEPWFVFCRPDGEAIIHFAKIDGSYLIASDALDRPVRGTDFRTLIDQIARLHPDLLPIPATGTGTTLVVHPAALLAALVAAAALSLSSEDAQASPLAAGPDDVSGTPASREGGPAPGHPQPSKATVTGPGDREADRKQFEALIISAMIFAAEAMAADHGATGAELTLDSADPAGAAASHAAMSDAAPTSSTGPGSGRGSGSAAQPAVLTAPGSGADPGSRPQPASDAGAAGIRIEGGAARMSAPGDMPKPSALQNQPPAQGVGGDVAPAATSAEAPTTRTSGQQASTGGDVEAEAAASDGSAPEASGGRAAPERASMAESAAQARSTQAASSGSFDAGIDAAKPAWTTAASETAPGRGAKEAASHEADDRGRGREAAATDGPGKNPEGEEVAPGESQSGGVDRGRGSPAETASGNGPSPGRDAPGDGPTGRTAEDHGSHEAAQGAKAPPPTDPTLAEQGADRLAAARGPSGERGSADEGGAAGHDVATDQSSASAGGPAQDARSPSSDHARGGPSDHGPGPHAATSRPSDDGLSAETGRERNPSDAAAGASSPSPAERAGDPAPHSQEGPAPHGPGASEKAAAHDAAGRDTPARTDDSDSARSERQAGQDARAESDAREAPAAGAQAHPDSAPPGDGAGVAAGPAAPTATAHVPAHGAHEGGPSASSRGAGPTAAIDATGHLVFHADSHQDHGRPAPSQGPEETAAHPTVGLVGLSDHAHPVHDPYHQT